MLPTVNRIRDYTKGEEGLIQSRLGSMPDGVRKLLHRRLIKALQHQDLVAVDLYGDQPFVSRPASRGSIPDSWRHALREFVTLEKRSTVLLGESRSSVRTRPAR